jgi:tetratricopeptide (TPR) repeat protein
VSSDRVKVLQQAQLMASRGQYGEAIAEWKKLAAEAPHDGSIYNSIGDLYLKRNASSEATASFLQAAKAFQAEGATLKAIAAYKKVLKCDPTRLEIYRNLGDLNAERGLISSAVQDYLMLAKFFLKERKTKEALETYKKIVTYDPSNLNAQQRIADLCVQENLQDDATKVYLQLGRERSAQGRYEEAKEAYLSVLRIDPKNSEASQFVESFKKRGGAPIQAHRPGGGAVAANQSGELSGPLAEATRRIAEGQYAGAEAILNQMLSREPGNPRICQLLAKLHLQQGDLQVALGEYRFLAGAALRAQDFTLAESLIQEFLLAQPNSAPLLEMCGQLYEDKNDPAAAAECYAKAVESLLTHPEPGMEGLHEELFEKVQALSPDAGLVARLAARIKGESAAEVGQSAEAHGTPIVSESKTPDVQSVSPAVDMFSIEGAESDEFRVPAASTRSGDFQHPISKDSKPEISTNPEKQASVHGTAMAHSQAQPDGGGFCFVNTTRQKPAQAIQDRKAGTSKPEMEVPQATIAPPPDYEAHFTLGVAYKNMGLCREAREEFERSKKGEPYYLDSVLLTALCYKEEGCLVQALTELELVLVDPRCQGTKGQAIRYELGLLYEAEAQWGKAVATFQSIPSFHDVPQRLAALKAHRSSEGAALRLAS